MNRVATRMALRRAAFVCALLVGAALLPSAVTAGTKENAVAVWNEYAVVALTNATDDAAVPGAGNTPPVSSLHMAMVQLAVYDAVNMIDRGHEPYLDGLPVARRSASLKAAVATAAHHVLVGLVPSLPAAVNTRLDDLYADYMDTIPRGTRRSAGIAAGAAAAAVMLDVRANDGRYVAFTFTTGTQPGQWRPTSGVSDPNAWVGKVTPFSVKRASQFRTPGPDALTSDAYAEDYNEVKRLGSTTSTRTDEQEALATFFVESPVLMFNRTYRAEVAERKMSIADSARLFGLLNVSIADAAIGCWDDKARWNFWRPVTAIHLGDTDGNPDTAPDPAWTPLVATPPYPDHPSGFNCLSGAAIHAAKAYFGTDHIALHVHSAPADADRSYTRLTDLLIDTIDARIYQGLHFRKADSAGAVLGQKTAEWVARHEFEARD